MNGTRNVLGSFALASLAAVAVACHHDDPNVAARDAQAAVTFAADGAVLPDVSPACSFVGEPVAIPGGALSVGDGIRDDDGSGAIFGVLRPTGAACWAHVDAQGGALSLHDLPPSDPDAPPPRVIARGGDRFLLYSHSAGAVGHVETGRARLDASASSLRLVLAKLDPHAVSPASGAETTAEIASQRDDSLDNDAAFAGPSGGGMVVWDEDEPFNRFGIIRAARVDTNGHLIGASVTLTADGTDAEAPRILPAGGGFLVVYRVRRGEFLDAGLVDNSAEGPGERPAFHWLEAVFVPPLGDGAGAAIDAGAIAARARKLTSPTDHVGTFDVFAIPGDTSAIDVVVHDNDAPKDGAGTRISRIRLAATTAGDVAAAVPIVPSGAGPGAVSRLESVPACAAARSCDAIVYAADDDSAQLVRLAASAGNAIGAVTATSREPCFDGADPVVRLPGGAILNFLRDRGGSLRTVTCR